MWLHPRSNLIWDQRSQFRVKFREDWDIETNNSANSWINQTYQQLLLKFCQKLTYIQPSGWNWGSHALNEIKALIRQIETSHDANRKIQLIELQTQSQPTTKSNCSNTKIHLMRRPNPSQANYKIQAAKVQYDIYSLLQRLRVNKMRSEHEEKVKI